MMEAVTTSIMKMFNADATECQLVLNVSTYKQLLDWQTVTGQFAVFLRAAVLISFLNCSLFLL